MQQIIQNITSDVFFTNLDKWHKRYQMSTVGGYMLPVHDTLSKNINNIVMCKKFQIVSAVKVLNMKASKRMVVRGILRDKFNPESLSELTTSNASDAVIGNIQPQDLSVDVVELTRIQIKNLTQGFLGLTKQVLISVRFNV